MYILLDKNDDETVRFGDQVWGVGGWEDVDDFFIGCWVVSDSPVFRRQIHCTAEACKTEQCQYYEDDLICEGCSRRWPDIYRPKK